MGSYNGGGWTSQPTGSGESTLIRDFAARLAEHYGSRIVDLEPDPACWPAPSAETANAVIVCADVIQHYPDTTPPLEAIGRLLKHASVAIVTTPDRDRCGGLGARWNRAEFRCLIEKAGLEVLFHGSAADSETDRRKGTILSVIRQTRIVAPVPPAFRVVALVTSYNEEDVIESFLEHTIGQGVEVLLLDNWSTDSTVERAARLVGKGLISITRFPEGGPSMTFEWHSMLAQKEERARRIEADWFIHLDPDEIRESPWPGVTIREALYRVQSEGFNAVNHTCAIFHPVGEQYRPGQTLQDQFSYFEFGMRPGHLVQIKAWKRQDDLLDLAESGGHEVRFPGRRVYPFRFLLRHYPIRSQEHGQRKVFRERLPRFSPALRQRGWNIQYDHLARDHSFVRDPATLLRFTPETFYEEYLVERLAGGRMAH
jgi:SAM-dependent methyltransferase